MPQAYLAIVLHAHLPYVHHPEYESFFEEDWLFEAVAETYIPLLLAFDRLRRDKVPFRITMSLTPTLLEMLVNPLLKDRCLKYLAQRAELAEKECRKEGSSDEQRALAEHYRWHFTTSRDFLEKRCGGNLVNAFREFQDAGYLEVLACAATHGFLPLMQTPNAVRAQVAVGVATVERHLGRRPRGIWLPECAYKPGLDQVLADEGITYFILDAHGVMNAFPVPPSGVHAPVQCPSGVAAFGRDLESSKQVWSSEEGYPGDGAYREFYRDLGYDAAYEDVKPYLHAGGIRHNLGIKYHRVTGRVDLSQKELYDRTTAVRRALDHGAHFVFCRQHQLRFLQGHIAEPPIVLSPYDAELFGHWWYEGPEFLEQVFRVAQHIRDDFLVCTPSDYLARHTPQQVSTPSSSSWGDKGYFEVWLNGGCDWIYRHLHKAEHRMVALAKKYASEVPSRSVRAALNQAARELMLAQSSDWAFLITNGTAPYAEKRTRNHLHRFTRLYNMIRSGNIDDGYVGRTFGLDPIFGDMDYRVYL